MLTDDEIQAIQTERDKIKALMRNNIDHKHNLLSYSRLRNRLRYHIDQENRNKSIKKCMDRYNALKLVKEKS